MKIAPLLIIFYIALAGIILFDGLMVGGMGWNAEPYTGESIATEGDPLSSLSRGVWQLFTDPTTWYTNPFIYWFTITFLAAVALISVTPFVSSTDMAFLIPLFAVIINAGILPLIAIYNVVHREVFRMVCTGELNNVEELISCTADQTTGAIILVAIFVGPLALAWAFACIEWWTQRPTS